MGRETTWAIALDDVLWKDIKQQEKALLAILHNVAKMPRSA